MQTRSLLSVLCVALVFIVCSPFVCAQECKTSPCPEPFGSCNQCYIGIEGIFPATREVCGFYDQEKCKKAFRNIFLCDDGINSCACVDTGGISAKMGGFP
ncbi:hypothetical protein CU098_007122 [Rhizopus stolonifer]|uniref:Uncharacterized protein n=1 Tax=Rhizopus stolonifer TaxID=4846 RepID=A0A367KM77_RHIST|nr:hypothetical protein CU098_007122 [Rhizopus stolonifer]